MADLVPIVTHLADPATWNAAGIINALNAHTWTEFTIGAYTAGQGIALTCNLAGEDQTIIIRKSASGSTDDVAVSIEPLGVITDPGNDTPTDPIGVTSDWSDDGIWDVTLGTPATGSKLWVTEYPDTILILITNSANTFYVGGCLAGRPLQPLNLSSVAEGQDGLGFFIGSPAAPIATAAAEEMFSKSTGVDAGLIHYETDNWGTRATVITPVGAWCGDGADGEARIVPPPVPMWVTPGGGTQTHYVGLLKYYRIVPAGYGSKTIQKAIGSNQGFLHVEEDASTLNVFTFITDARVSP